MGNGWMVISSLHSARSTQQVAADGKFPRFTGERLVQASLSRTRARVEERRVVCSERRCSSTRVDQTNELQAEQVFQPRQIESLLYIEHGAAAAVAATGTARVTGSEDHLLWGADYLSLVSIQVGGRELCCATRIRCCSWLDGMDEYRTRMCEWPGLGTNWQCAISRLSRKGNCTGQETKSCCTLWRIASRQRLSVSLIYY